MAPASLPPSTILVIDDEPQIRRVVRNALAGACTWARWRRRLFALMARNARPATAFFGLPANRVVELGAQIRL